MKKIRLLSIVFSLIMIVGVTSNTSFAESDEYTLDDKLEGFCMMTDEEKQQFFVNNPDMEQFKDKLATICDMSEDKRDIAIENFIVEQFPEAKETESNDLDDKLDRYCEMTEEAKKDFISMNDKSEDDVVTMNVYCELDENQQDSSENESRMSFDKDTLAKLNLYCKMSDTDRKEFLTKYDKEADHAEMMDKYCNLNEKGRMKFIEEHNETEMKDKSHMKYDKLCTLSESDRALEIDDSEKLAEVSKWCAMTSEEKKDYKNEHQDKMQDKAMDKVHDKLKMSEMSPRLQSMITEYDISDEKLDEIKIKYKEKHGDMTDTEKSELKMKFENYMSSIKVKMSEERKSEIHDRLADMKVFKSELREQASELTDEEKQQLRADFIEQAKDMQLAWISPRTQMNAGVDVQEIECREGFSLVMKASNGVPICLKSDTALKMIEKGIAVPAT